MAVNDVYEVSLLYSLKGEKCANVFHVQEMIDPGANNEAALANDVYVAFWFTVMQSVLSNDLRLQQIRVRRIHPTAGGPVIQIVDEDGTVTEDSLPSNNTVLISLYSNRLDRAGRGRIFLPGIPDTHNQDGLLPQSVLTDYENIGQLFVDAFTVPTLYWQAGIWSKTEQEFNAIVAFEVRSWIHTLRGRRAAAP